MRRGSALIAVILLMLLLAIVFLEREASQGEPDTVAAPAQESGLERPGHWAQPCELAGCPDLYKVSDDLYRGAQPSAEGMRNLKELGIKTIVNLRSFHSDRDEMGQIDFNYHHIYVKTWHPERKEIVRFLRIVADREQTPVFVHCQYGADRTGLMVAVYRVVVHGWSKEEALEEMTRGGYGFHEVWRNLVRYFNELDFEGIRRDAGVASEDAGNADTRPQSRAETRRPGPVGGVVWAPSFLSKARSARPAPGGVSDAIGRVGDNALPVMKTQHPR